MSLDKLIAAIDARTGFDRWGPEANPLIRQALRRTERLSLRATLGLAFALGTGGALRATAFTLSSTTNDLSSAEWVINLVGWAFSFTAPLMAVSLSLRATHHTVHAEAYELTFLTPLPNETLVRAHLFLALYRLRFLLAALVAIMPFLVIEFFHLMVAIYALSRAYNGDPPTYSNVVGPTLTMLLMILGLWGFTLLGAAVGVRAAILRRSLGAAGLVVLIQMSAAAICSCAWCWLGSSALTSSTSVDTAIGSYLFMALLWAIVPYVVTTIAAWDTALKWQR